MTTKEFIEKLSELPSDVEVMVEVGGNAAYKAAGSPYLRNLGDSMGRHRDYVCIGSDVNLIIVNNCNYEKENSTKI